MLPHPNITPIPDNEPDAVPSLWNTRYAEIDDNFQNHEGRVGAVETEIVAARGGQANINARLTGVESDLEGLESSLEAQDPDMQNMVVASLIGMIGNQGVLAKQLAWLDDEGALQYFAIKILDDLALAHKEIKKTLNMRFQEGLITIKNRAVISGCAVSKSTTAARNVTLASGKFFVQGRSYSVQELVNCASIPNNNSASGATCYVFLWIDANGVIQCDSTDLGQAVPDNGVTLYEVTVPANNNDINDPNLASVTLTDRRRLEANWPTVLAAPPYALVALGAPIVGADYVVQLDLVSFTGPTSGLDEFLVQDRLVNGFKVYFSGMADDLVVRYLVSRPGA